jgi:hypothetical protein
MTTNPPLPKSWNFLTGDLNWSEWDGSWYKTTDNDTYQVISLTNLHHAMDHNHPNKYLIEVHELTLSEIDELIIENALHYSSLTNEPEITNEMKVEALIAYGGYSTWNSEGNNHSKLFKNAMEIAY